MPNALAVVAHHDDHVLWMGGTLNRMLSHGWNWTLVAMCVPDSDRQNYFCDFCEAHSVVGHYFQFKDYMNESAFSHNVKTEMRDQLAQHVKGQSFDWVFTHSRRPEREYGHHANHAEVEQVVTSLVHDGSLGCGMNHLAYFSYRWNDVCGTPTVARLDASHYLQPNYDELMIKCNWCNKVPDLENLKSLSYPCPSPEAFEGGVGIELELPDNPDDEVFQKRFG